MDLSEYLSVNRRNYDACFDVVEHTEQVDGFIATTRLHYLRFDGNGQPMVDALAECLVRHIIDYCIAARNRPANMTPQDAVRYTQEARKLFIPRPPTVDDPDQTGQAGELLLYFLIESVLQAAQVVAKMELKTNPRVEVHGSDGIHIRWNEAANVADIFFGEAKLHQTISSAIASALRSVDAFHAKDMRRHEFTMVTKHFKYSDSNVRNAVADLLEAGVPGTTARINHVLLIGYDWSEYAMLPTKDLEQLSQIFTERYLADAPRLHEVLKAALAGFSRKHLRFEVFFLPFRQVQEFRDAFNKALG